MPFVHLHVHSQFSLLDGTASVKDLAKRAAKLGMPALALTDTCNLYGAVAFYKACKDAGIRAVLGAELHVQPEGIDHKDARREEGGYQLGVLVEDERGYLNLCELVTRAIFDGMSYKPRVDLELLARHKDGLIALTGGRKGVVGRPLLGGDPSLARERFDALAGIFGRDHLYLELQDVGLDGQDRINEGIRALAAATGHRLVVTNPVHYLDPEDAAVLDVLHAIGAGCSLNDPERIQTATDQAWLKSEAEMAALFPDDRDALDLSGEIAERCHYKFTFGTYHFPATTPPDLAADGTPADTAANWAYFYDAFPPPRDYGIPVDVAPRPEGAGSIDGYFAWYCRRGLDLRLPDVPEDQHAAYRDRLEMELKTVAKMGFPAYLLIVAEFINWSKDHGIPVGPGRGSAAGSIAAWAMRITDIDPIRYGLLFERFLNPERVSMPDIDVDFCQDRREEAIAHVRDKYGTDRVSQIITYGTLKAKAAVRDVARVLDLSFTEADRIAKLVPDRLGITLQEALDEEPRLKQLRDGDPKVRRVLDLAMRIEGNLRQTGVHAAGVVIADQPLVKYAPLYRDQEGGGPVVQYDMKSAESVGLIKFDFLGLKTLDQIRDAVAMIEANHQLRLDMARIPVDDALTYSMLQDGDALGIFQLESSGMRELLSRLKPNVIDDMVALVALYRPGPLQSGMTDEFVERKHGRVAVDYPLPQLEPILQSTYGTIIYQEQVMQIAQVMASYSLGEADLLRRAMGKKDKNEMAKQKDRFVQGSVSNGIPGSKAEEIFDMMEKFAEYGFNKSHSAAYGYISYQTAYLKAHYRPEYMAALMTVDSANTDKVLGYVLDTRRAGIVVEPVCINRSTFAFSVPPPAQRPTDAEGRPKGIIRFGLSAVKNVGQGAIEAILEARKAAGGTFRDAFDVFDKLDWKRVNRRVVESLIKAGAFDTFGVPRAALFSGLEAACSLAQRRQQDRESGQIGLFAAFGSASARVAFRWPDEPEWGFGRKMAYEREVLGLYLSGHPMQAHERDVMRFATGPMKLLPTFKGTEEVRVMGLVVDQRTTRTRRGDKMAFVRLEDHEASVEVTFFSEALARSRAALDQSGPILVVGSLEVRDDEVKIMATSAETLTSLRERTTRQVRFSVELDELRGEQLQRFYDILKSQRGSCDSLLVVRRGGRYEAELKLPEHPVAPSAEMEESVHALFGRADVVALG